MMQLNRTEATVLDKAVAVKHEVKKAVLGKDNVINKILTAIIAGGHILLDDIPGVGKTTIALAFSRAMSLEYHRMQFTPDVLPADVTGFSMYDKRTDSFIYKPGAVICNLFLADEINRTSSKTQSALLEIMEEGKVTVDGITREMPDPFTVIATENPVGSVGTQMLPDSQLDRFMIQLSIGYPDKASEVSILKGRQGANPLETVEAVASSEDIIKMREIDESTHTDDKIFEYITSLASATRENDMLLLGLSPRGTLAIAKLARAHAFLSGRAYVIPDDVQEVFLDASAHRVSLSPKARIASMDEKDVLTQILKNTPIPKI